MSAEPSVPRPWVARSAGFVRPRIQGDGFRAYDGAGTEHLDIFHNGSNGALRFSKGALVIQSDEDTDHDTEVQVKGKGTGIGLVKIFDEDDVDHMKAYMVDGSGFLETAGASAVDLHLQAPAHAGVSLFAAAGVGQNPYVSIFGWDAAGSARRYARMRISPADGAFEVEAQSGRDILFKTAGVEQARLKSDKLDLQQRIDTPMTVLKTQALPGTVVLGGSVYDGTNFYDGAPIV